MVPSRRRRLRLGLLRLWTDWAHRHVTCGCFDYAATYGSLGLMVLKTLEALGPLHGYRIARRIEQISGNQLAVNQSTLCPALLKLEQMDWINSKWGESESGRRVKIYSLTPTWAALGLTRLIASMLFGISAHDPVTIAGVVSLLTFVAFAA